MRNEVDLTGLRLGGWLLIARAPHGRGSDGSVLWRCKCTICGRERHVSVGYVRTLQRRRKALLCATCKVKANPSSRCRRCGNRGHLVADCRRSTRGLGRICQLCGSLPHRVTGKRCAGCRLRFEPEQTAPVECYISSGTSALAAIMRGGDS